MPKKQLSFIEQAQDMEKKNKDLQSRMANYNRIIDVILKEEFGMRKKALQRMIDVSQNSYMQDSQFEKKICDYFGIDNEFDKADFLRIMLTDTSRKYFEKKRYEVDVDDSTVG